MNSKAVFGILIALLLPMAGYFIIKNVSGDALAMPRHYIYDSVAVQTVNGKERTDTLWHAMPDFSLINQLGHSVSQRDMKDKIVVADFFFTHCPNICPQLTINLKRVHDAIKNSEKVGNQQPDFVQFLSFSIDPERDSVPALKQWADRFQINPENWWLLTGNKKEIYDLSINDMKLMAVDGNHVDTNFIHTDYVVLIDRNKNIRGYYHGLDTNSMSQLSRDIVFLALEKDKKSKGAFSGQLELVAVVVLMMIIGLGILMFFLKKETATV